MLTFTSTSIKQYDSTKTLILCKPTDLITVESFGYCCTAACESSSSIIYALTDGYTSVFYKLENDSDHLLLKCKCLTPTAVFYSKYPEILAFSSAAGTFYYSDGHLREFTPKCQKSLKIYANRYIFTVSLDDFHIIDVLTGLCYSSQLNAVFLCFGTEPVIFTSKFALYVDLQSFTQSVNPDCFLRKIHVAYDESVNKQIFALSNRIQIKIDFSFLFKSGILIQNQLFAFAICENGEYGVVFRFEGVKIHVENVIQIPKRWNGREIRLFDQKSICLVDFDGFCTFQENSFYRGHKQMSQVNFDGEFGEVIEEIEAVRRGGEKQQNGKQKGWQNRQKCIQNTQKPLYKKKQNKIFFESTLQDDASFFEEICRKPAVKTNKNVISDQIYANLGDSQKKEIKDRYVADQLDQIYCNYDEYKKITKKYYNQ